MKSLPIAPIYGWTNGSRISSRYLTPVRVPTGTYAVANASSVQDVDSNEKSKITMSYNTVYTFSGHGSPVKVICLIPRATEDPPCRGVDQIKSVKTHGTVERSSTGLSPGATEINKPCR
ncbi:hypothetical protein TNCV_4141331 [Trichonephila clavipes]|nr:hypothetical protein TNCV_4141331 [Trichonephila clavipes]